MKRVGFASIRLAVLRIIARLIIQNFSCTGVTMNVWLTINLCTYDYMVLIISSVCIIIFLLLLCYLGGIHLSLNNNKAYALPIVWLHALPNSPRILTTGLQAHISRRSVYLRTNPVTRPIERYVREHSFLQLVRETPVKRLLKGFYNSLTYTVNNRTQRTSSNQA